MSPDPSTEFEGRITMDLTGRANSQKATLAWLESALEYARAQGQETLVGYLEAVMEDVVFEMKMTTQKASAVG